MTEREKIFERIREALRTKAHLPGHAAVLPTAPHTKAAAGQKGIVAGTASSPLAAEHRSHSRGDGAVPAPVPQANGVPPSAHAREWLPRVGKSFEERLSLFQKTAEDLKAVVLVLDSEAQALEALFRVRDAERWKKIAAHRGVLVDPVVDSLNLPVCRTDGQYQVRDLESCDVGITQCDALVAQTGSVLITSRSAGGRALSVLPPHHVVLARKEQLVADLPEAFGLLKRTYSSNYPSFISLITGPSRTGDIERTLVLGAHGPKKLTIIVY